MEGQSSRLDTAYRLLADPRRRTLIELLDDEERRLTVNDLTKEIAARESDEPITELSTEHMERIYLSLHHVHVPKLDGAGVVEYDRKRSIVEPTDALDHLVAHYRALESELDESPPDDPPVP